MMEIVNLSTVGKWMNKQHPMMNDLIVNQKQLNRKELITGWCLMDNTDVTKWETKKQLSILHCFNLE